jgi:HPt (histidine-containing phosphotransfer) domain-containing protein
MSLDDALAGLARKFQQRCLRDAQALRDLVAAGDLDSPAGLQLTHGLAGAGGTFGFAHVSAAARQVENALKGHRPEAADISALLAALDDCPHRAPVYEDAL